MTSGMTVPAHGNSGPITIHECRAEQDDQQNHRPQVPPFKRIGTQEFAPGLALNEVAEAEFKNQRHHEPECADTQGMHDVSDFNLMECPPGDPRNTGTEQQTADKQRPGIAQPWHQNQFAKSTVDERENQYGQPWHHETEEEHGSWKA